jgi:hypothetical protein
MHMQMVGTRILMSHFQYNIPLERKSFKTIQFLETLNYIRNVEHLIDDWDLLMSQVIMRLPHMERGLFD